MIAEAALNAPLTGLARELLLLGSAKILEVLDSGFSSEDLGKALLYVLGRLDKKAKANSSRIFYNEAQSYQKALNAWFGVDPPDTYTELCKQIIEKTANALIDGTLDAYESLQSITVDKKGPFLGIPYNGKMGIIPSVVKQPNYYEFQTEFLRPTKGRKSMPLLDPVWLSLICVGFLVSFAGFIDGNYYFITKPDLDLIGSRRGQLSNVLEDILNITLTNMDAQIRALSEELYEMKLALRLAELKIIIRENTFPLVLHLVEREQNVFTEIKTLQLDIRDLLSYMNGYIQRLGELRIMGYGNKRNEFSPLGSLINVAERELRRRVYGDNEMVAYIFLKDLYRAINSGNEELLEDSIFRIFRKGRALLSTGARVDSELRKVLGVFLSEGHLRALL